MPNQNMRRKPKECINLIAARQRAQGWPVKSIIYVQHCLIPPVTLQTSPKASLSHWTKQAIQMLTVVKSRNRALTEFNLFTGLSFETR
jgi:hypothetical protein